MEKLSELSLSTKEKLLFSFNDICSRLPFFVEKPAADLIFRVTSIREVQRLAIAADLQAAEIKEKTDRSKSADTSRMCATLGNQLIKNNLPKNQRRSLAFSSIDRIKSARILTPQSQSIGKMGSNVIR